jgi:bla regulator protein BlaR1
MIPTYLSPLANHLWQSSLFAAVAGLLVFSLKKHYAPARHWLWLAASVKFLIPFSLLTGLGAQLGWIRPPVITVHRVSIVTEDINRPFVPLDIALPGHPDTAHPVAADSLTLILLAVWLSGCAFVLFRWWSRWRRVSATVRASLPLREGREFEALRCLERIAGIRKPVELLSSKSSLEPGIFGILRPVLLLPAGIADRLADGQLDAILAHELCHVRRRDNLMAALHMLVESIFWFHPLVWWLGARLVEERERACDEEVLRLGSEPQVYAESILKVCEFYLESPLVCASGVTGADLKKRIEDIMTHRISRKLDLARKVLLAVFGMAAVAGPIVIGLVNAPPSRAQEQTATAPPKEFEVASIKPSAPSGPMNRIRVEMAPGGRFNASNITVKFLIQQAYGVKDFQITGGPGWINSERYDLVAKADGDVGRAEQLRPLIQKLLADRFQLTIHRDTKELPIYALVVGKNGPKFKESEASGPGPNIRMGRGLINGQGMGMDMLASQLSNPLGRTVLDRTGLKGRYDIKLEFTPEEGAGRGPGDGPEAAPPPDTTGPSLFTALQEQLGLKLESSKGPVEIIVIDRIEKPTEN